MPNSWRLRANAPYLNRNSPAGSTLKLTGVRFSYADGVLAEASTWTYDTKATGRAGWGALEALGDGRVAASWSVNKTATAPGKGHTVVLSAADGTVGWQTESTLYGRQLHLDASRGRLVAVEQADATDGVRYEIVAYALADGARTTLDNRVNALPTGSRTPTGTRSPTPGSPGPPSAPEAPWACARSWRSATGARARCCSRS
ncbi:hypothetical protein [Streptomyces exfoliatus]|uniref:hypothetical protein n=1 Tax=Streptomyces exfoliatus TaxID=1905 RepID=UPI0004C541E6|nr:hypothetical protein [Streptomyces exfoliatus]